jgi:hypothetical protein
MVDDSQKREGNLILLSPLQSAGGLVVLIGESVVFCGL